MFLDEVTFKMRCRTFAKRFQFFCMWRGLSGILVV